MCRTQALLKLNPDEVHPADRSCHEHVIYDDDYGIWTERDQILAAEEIFRLLDKAEDLEQNL